MIVLSIDVILTSLHISLVSSLSGSLEVSDFDDDDSPSNYFGPFTSRPFYTFGNVVFNVFYDFECILLIAATILYYYVISCISLSSNEPIPLIAIKSESNVVILDIFRTFPTLSIL